jgi:hypothetical protein
VFATLRIISWKSAFLTTRWRNSIFVDGSWGAAASSRRWKTWSFFGGLPLTPRPAPWCGLTGVDLCPDVLYAEATGKAISELGAGLEVI